MTTTAMPPMTAVGIGGPVSQAESNPLHSSAVRFLSSIRMAPDPTAPPPPLWPHMSLQSAWAALGPVRASTWRSWEAARPAAAVAFLSSVPTGNERADQRPPPVLHFAPPAVPPTAAQVSLGAAAAASQPITPQHAAAASAAAAAAAAASPSDTAIAASSLSRVASGDTAPDGSSLPPRLATPPSMFAGMGLGVPLGVGMGTPGQTPRELSSSASLTGLPPGELYASPLLFPHALSSMQPVDLHRASTALVPSVGAPLPFGLSGDRMARATSEYEYRSAFLRGIASMPTPGRLPPKFPTPPQLSAQGSTEAATAAGSAAQGAAEQAALPVDAHRTPSPELALVAAKSATPELLAQDQAAAAAQAAAQSASSEVAGVPALAVPSGVTPSDESWEASLRSSGASRARLVYVSGGSAATSPRGAPVMLSSVAPFVRDDSPSSSSSASSSAANSPKVRSRAHSIDEAAAGEAKAAALAKGGGLAKDSLTRGDTHGATSLDRHAPNALLALAAASARAQEEHEAEMDAEWEELRREGLVYGRRKGTSYAYLLPRHQAAAGAKRAAGAGGAASIAGDSTRADRSASLADSSSQLRDSNDSYDPYFLDDPSIKSGRHRVVLSLPSLVSSLVSYVRQSDLKAELNARFRAAHGGWIRPSVTLSKIRKCKTLMLDVGVELDLELSCVAVAFIYFEKLVLTNRVDKPNRKLMAAVSMLLAFKWTEGRSSSEEEEKASGATAAVSNAAAVKGRPPPTVRTLLQSCERHLGVSRSSILRAEFPVYVQLDFNLTVKTEHVLHHLRQILTRLDAVSQEYKHIEWSL